MVKGERTTRKRWGKREYLNGSKTRELERGLDKVFSGISRNIEYRLASDASRSDPQ